MKVHKFFLRKLGPPPPPPPPFASKKDVPKTWAGIQQKLKCVTIKDYKRTTEFLTFKRSFFIKYSICSR